MTAVFHTRSVTMLCRIEHPPTPWNTVNEVSCYACSSKSNVVLPATKRSCSSRRCLCAASSRLIGRRGFPAEFPLFDEEV